MQNGGEDTIIKRVGCSGLYKIVTATIDGNIEQYLQ